MKVILPLLIVLAVVLAYLAYGRRPIDTTLADPLTQPKPAKAKIAPAKSEPEAPPATTSTPSFTSQKSSRLAERNDLSKAASEISQAELERRAAKVEQASNHELNRLVKLLDLTPAQQDQVFAALAQNSPDFHPTMAIAAPAQPALAAVSSATAGIGGLRREDVQMGQSTITNFAFGTAPALGNIGNVIGQVTTPTPPPVTTPTVALTPPTTTAPDIGTPPTAPVATPTISIDEMLAPYLTPEQQSTLSEEEVDRIAWWKELTTNLADGLAIPAIPDTVTQTYDDSL